MSDSWRIAGSTVCLSLLLIGVVVGSDVTSAARADDANPVASEEMKPTVNEDENSGAKRITPDQFSEVDKLTTLTVFTLVIFIVGVVALLALIVIGARRMRRMTRSPLLKSKYDELELLREKYRREVEGFDTPPPPSRESRR